MRLCLALLAACMLLVGGGTWWFANGDEAAPTSRRADVAPADASADPSVPVSVTDAAADPEADDERDDATAPAEGELDPDAELERTAAPTDVVVAPRVLVVRGAPPVPVADAEVLFVTEADAQQRLGDRAGKLARHQWPEAIGQRMRTGDDGIAQLPAAGVPLLCAARDAGEFAFRVVPPRDRVFTLALQPDERVVLEVLYADEKPAKGMPLAILQQRGKDEARTVWRGDSGADGRAVVEHFQLVREQAHADERFAALPMVPGGAVVPFTGRPAPTEPVQLVVPELGGVRARVVDHAGNPVLSPAVVAIAGASGPSLPTDAGLHVPRGLVNQRTQKPAGADPVLLPYHLVGEQVRVAVRFALDRRVAEVGPVAGPTQPGEVVDVVVPLAPTHALLAGQFVLANGAPFAGNVRGALWRADRDVLTANVVAIADGRFDVVLAQRTDATEYWLDLRAEVGAKDGDTVSVERVGARVRVPAIRGGTRIELGTITLGPLPTLVAGWVLDDAGHAVEGAEVTVQQQTPPRENQRPDEAWRPLPLLRARTLADGSFAIDGVLPAGTLRVRADTDAHFADSVPLHSAGQQVRIMIVRNGILRGRVLLPDWLADGAVSLQLQPFDEAARQRDTRAVDLQRGGGGRFTVEPLRPGRFDARVLLRNVTEPIAVLPDVFVTSGEVRDPRMQPLDLREAVFRYRLRAVDGGGQPVKVDGPILARLSKLDGATIEAGFRWRQGRAEIVTGGASIDLVCFGRGHRTVRVTLGPGEHDVVLPATRPAMVELAGLRALCGPGRKVRVSAILRGDTGLPASLGGTDQRSGEKFGFARWDLGRTSGGWLGVSDVVEIPLVVSGKYELLLRPHATDSEKSPQGQLSLGVYELEVDGVSWEPVRVPVDSGAVMQVLQELDEQSTRRQPR